MFKYLQEDYEDVGRTQRTLHYLAACVQQTPEEIKDFLPVWISEHEDWCRRISEKFLQKRKIAYKQYFKEFLHPAFPMDLLGIGIFARAYKKHVAVFYNTKFWTTEINRDLSKVHVFLVYTGQMDFENTRRMHVWEYDNTRDIVLKYQKTLVKDRHLIDPSQTESEESSDEESVPEQTPIIETDEDIEDMMNRTVEKEPIPHNILDDNNGEPVSEETSVHGNIQHNISDANLQDTENDEHNMQATDNNVTQGDDNDNTVGDIMSKNDADEHSNGEIDHPLVDDTLDGKQEDIMPKDDLNKSTDSSTFKRDLNEQVISSGEHLVQQFLNAENRKEENHESDGEMDLEDVLEKGIPVIKPKPKRNQCKSKRIQLKKKIDKEKTHRMQLTPVKETSARKTANSMKSDYGHFIKDIMSKTKAKKSIKGFWKIQPRGLPLRPKIKKRKNVLRCFLCGNKVSSSAKELNEHIMQKHPSYKFKCHIKGCRKQFCTKNSLYRHKLAHQGMRYYCKRKSCDKAFVWKHQLVDHMKSHTKKNMYECDFPGCDKAYPTKRACQRHNKLKHSPSKTTYTCQHKYEDNSQCDKTFSSKQQFDQHVQGLHGPGFQTRCGKFYTWPYQRAEHQKECRKCEKVQQKKTKTF